MKTTIGSALVSTLTEVLDSKKWVGSYIAAALACVLHLYFGVSIENALLLASPISLGVLGQAHVDAATAKASVPAAPTNVNTVVNEPTPPPAQAGFVRFDLLCLVVFVLALGACGWMRSESRRATNDLVDCVGKKAQAEIKQYGSAVDAAIELATGQDGKLDRAKLFSATKGFALDAGACVLADAVARVLAPKSADPNAPQSSSLDVDPGDLRAAFADIARERYAGKRFQTTYGAL